MGFFSRLFRIFFGKANDAVDSAEMKNIDTVLRQSMREAQDELNKLTTAAASVLGGYNKLASEQKNHMNEAGRWKADAMKALNAGNEDLAKKCLIKSNEFVGKAQGLASELESISQKRAEIHRAVDIQRHKISELQKESSQLVARGQLAKANKELNAVLAGVNSSDNAFATVDRLKERVSQEEGLALGYAELSKTKLADDASYELKKLSEAEAERQLEMLKLESSGMIVDATFVTIDDLKREISGGGSGKNLSIDVQNVKKLNGR